MYTVTHTADFDVSVSESFRFVGDHTRVTDWMFGMECYEPIGEQQDGAGARYDTRVKIGPLKVKLVIEISEWVEDQLIVMKMTRGPIDGSFSWRFVPAPDGGTRLVADASYSLIGGPLGKALAAGINAILGQAIEHSERKLREHLTGDHAA